MNNFSPSPACRGGLATVVLGLLCCAGMMVHAGCGSGDGGSTVQQQTFSPPSTPASPFVRQVATITAIHGPRLHTANRTIYRLPPIGDSSGGLPWETDVSADLVADFDISSPESRAIEVMTEPSELSTSGGNFVDSQPFPSLDLDLDLGLAEPDQTLPERSDWEQLEPELTEPLLTAEEPSDNEEQAQKKKVLVIDESGDSEEALPPSIVASPDTLDVYRTEAHKIVQRAFSLANRGMLYSARREFLRALRMLACAKDAVVGGREFSQKLSAGIRTIDEADDFRSQGRQLESEMDLETIVSSHQTSLLKEDHAVNVSPPAAIEAYYHLASEQLGAAVAGEPAGSMALYGLARIQQHLATEETADSMAGTDKAITLHSAALLAHPRNHLAANEAGVLLTRQGRLDKAASMLERAVCLAPTSVGHHNLAIVQQRQGQYQLANVTAQRAQVLATQQQAPVASVGHGVVWVDPQTFTGGVVPNRPAPSVVKTEPPRKAPQPRRVTARGSQWMVPAWLR